MTTDEEVIDLRHKYAEARTANQSLRAQVMELEEFRRNTEARLAALTTRVERNEDYACQTDHKVVALRRKLLDFSSSGK